MNTKNLFWSFILIITLLRLRVASQFGLGVDEAHYVLYGKLLDWSYFDHPPLVGWIQALFQLIPLDHLIQARLPAILISILTSKLILDYLVSKKISTKSALLSVAALNLTPMYNAMSVALLPDTLLMPLTLLIISTTEKILYRSNLKNWLLLGLWLGLAGLSKYTAILYIISLVIIFIYDKKLKELLSLNLWAGVILAFLCITPVLYWNAQNDWISFKYQTDHVLTDNSLVFKNYAASFVMQIISWGIGPFLISLLVFFNLVKTFKSHIEFKISLIFLSVFLLFFIYIAKNEPLLPHWMLIYFILAIPITFAWLIERQKWIKMLWGATILSTIITLAMLFELAFKVFPTATTVSLYEGIKGWDQIIDEANHHLLAVQNNKKGLAVMNWTLGSRAMYYNNTQSLVYVIDQRFDQFDIWNKNSPLGSDLIVIVEALKKEEHLSHLNCGQLTSIGEKKSYIKNIPVNHFLYYHCADFKAYR